MPRLSFLIALLCVPLIVGCDGCRRDPTLDKDKDAEELPRDAFTTYSPDPFPSVGLLADGGVPAGRAIKPGHWISASVSIKSNLDDSRGELVCTANAQGIDFSTGDSMEGRNRFTAVPSSRPIVLPKGQLRRFDYRLLTPVTGGNAKKTYSLSGKFVPSGRAVPVNVPTMPFIAMQPEEYFFVVLTNRPERFAKLRKADWIKPYRDEFDFPIAGANYRVITASTKDLLPIADTMLDWTNTAVLVWDNVTDDVLTPDQRTAIADWIRFGGKLIVNGPDASDALGRSAFRDVLAFQPSGNIELDPQAGESLLKGWQVKTDRSTSKQIEILKSQSGRVAVDGPLAVGATLLENSGGLIAKRQVGRGSVTQTRFDVTSDWVVDWESFDSFFNNAILDRPHRRYSASEGQAEGGGMATRQYDAVTGSVTSDAAMNTQFRIATRDAKILTASPEKPTNAPENLSSSLTYQTDPFTRIDPSTGISGWTDSSDLVEACSQILRNESGIEIPKSSLVVRSLGYYLLILVPLNFIIFRLMGRLEYAWLAVPVIAIVGAIWVARSAQLDIGFARSQTEIAVLEMQPSYPRAHLTRIDAIYNSLSSTYRFDFKTIDGCASPMRNVLSQSDAGNPMFSTSYNEGPSLSGMAVGSNQVRMVHAEQIVDVGGGIRLDSSGKLVNGSPLEILDSYVIEKDAEGNIRVAVVGLVSPQSATTLRYLDWPEVNVSDELPMQTALLIRQLTLPSSIPSGSTRLVGRVSDAIDGMTITPKATQTLAQTIVLAHLKHAPLKPGQPDVNLKSDVSKRR
ncbi:hypothetical protein [Rubripirellula reticaptiva]|uniref:DUF4350 domain-containing protein n=1 Tax=Rubripirellula reticaptiva TaxID=2528013 RepID=A0A5C6EH95_9BACT|nr:hypothetical protein [Rubripirellula reticaptiva]TWU48372.1 hypothetical protein Poly59_52190 [Rubripirellula reticaptiva]